METVDFHKSKKKRVFSPMRRIAFSFFMVLLVGSFLLACPFSNHGVAPYIDHLFVATSATCVTGLVPFVVADQYTFIGQLVIILLIQIGGLGFLTLLNMFIYALRKKLTYTNKIIMQEALNQNSMASIGIYIKRVIKYTAFFELVGALLLSIVFVPEYGVLKGLYYGLWHSISAFCNAGFDILGANSLIPYQTHILMNFTIAGLIIAGGLGFVVWIDLRMSWQHYKENFKFFKLKTFFASLSLHTKIVLFSTILLLLSGTLVILFLEYNNPGTLGPLSLGDKILASFFQSTTTRTAGFASVNMVALHDSTKLFMSILMFIGGSPAGTAGGIKTVTLVIALMYIYSLQNGNENVTMFKRRIDNQVVKRSLTIAILSFFICSLGLFILSMNEGADFIDLIFEVFSAFGTVGLSASLTPTLTVLGKIVIIILMFIGRIGPLTMVFVFAKKYKQKKGQDIMYPVGDVLIG